MIKLNTKVCRIMFSDDSLKLRLENASLTLGLVEEHPTFIVYRNYEAIPKLMVVNNTVVRNLPTWSTGVTLTIDSLIKNHLI